MGGLVKGQESLGNGFIALTIYHICSRMRYTVIYKLIVYTEKRDLSLIKAEQTEGTGLSENFYFYLF